MFQGWINAERTISNEGSSFPIKRDFDLAPNLWKIVKWNSWTWKLCPKISSRNSAFFFCALHNKSTVSVKKKTVYPIVNRTLKYTL